MRTRASALPPIGKNLKEPIVSSRAPSILNTITQHVTAIRTHRTGKPTGRCYSASTRTARVRDTDPQRYRHLSQFPCMHASHTHWPSKPETDHKPACQSPPPASATPSNRRQHQFQQHRAPRRSPRSTQCRPDWVSTSYNDDSTHHDRDPRRQPAHEPQPARTTTWWWALIYRHESQSADCG